MDADARASAAAAERQWDDLHTEVDMNDVGGPFEGPEKLLELWFAPVSYTHLTLPTTPYA